LSAGNGRIDPSNPDADPAAFAPANPTDNRAPGEWQSRYPKQAWRQIWLEALYLVTLLAIVPILTVTVWLEIPKSWAVMTDVKYAALTKYSLSCLGGLLGGTLFSLKWLYHSVARQIWHEDRRLWRLFTPLISAGLAFAILALVSSGIFRVFDRTAPNSRSVALGIGFLVGYFSDSAIAKLMEIAETVFGASRARERHLESSRTQRHPDGRDD
jgi:hypothetical protein